MKKRLLMLAPVILVLGALFAALGGEIVHRLWNWLLPPLFGWPQIGFWQAMGLLVLCRILFGGFSMAGGRSGRRPISERWQHMSPEERERFRRGIWGRLGFTPQTGESAQP